MEFEKPLRSFAYDPYNQFAFWVSPSGSIMGISTANTRLCDRKPKVVALGLNVDAFAVLPKTFAVLVPDRAENKLYLIDVESGNKRYAIFWR